MLQMNPMYMIAGLMVLGLVPFIAIMTTSYVKLVVVLSLLRNALGIQQIPPNMVINGMAVILSIFIMAPVAHETYEIAIAKQDGDTEIKLETVAAASDDLSRPMKGFLTKHSTPSIRLFFMRAALRLWPKNKAIMLDKESWYILIPAFMLTELTEAFQIGFILYLPFIIIDLVISNILLAMGMMMVSPMTISLPFKLLMFVLLNGWLKIIEGLIMTYQ
jgi:type III secretion protein R